MPFAIPSLLERSKAAWASIRARLPGADGEIWPNNLRIIGKVIAQAAHEGDLRSSYLWRQIFTTTADGEYLDLHAYEVGLVRKPASPATGMLVVAATPGVGFSAGIRFIRSDGAAYVSSASALADPSGTATIAIVAVDPGLAGNTVAGAAFGLDAPVPDLAGDGVVGPDGLGNGANGEGDASLRGRILFRKRNRPRGGSAADYVEWATEVPGIARAFAKPWQPGAGCVSVWPLREGSGMTALPTTSDLEAVAAHIESRRPAAATAYVQGSSPRTIDIVISGLDPDQVTVQAEVLAELDDLFDERAAVAMPDQTNVFSRSWISEAVSAALGEDRHVLVAPATDVTLAPGEFPVRGSLLFL